MFMHLKYGEYITVSEIHKDVKKMTGEGDDEGVGRIESFVKFLEYVVLVHGTVL